MKRSYVFLLVGLLLIVFGGTSLLVAENQKGHAAVLAAEGVPAKGTVKDKVVLKGSRGAMTFLVTIVNHDSDDAEVQTEVLREKFDEVQKGDEVDIVYLPSDPHIFDFGNVDHERALLHQTKITEIWSPLCILVGLVLAGIGLKAAAKEPFR